MKKITMFYLASCPYCIEAFRFMDELMKKDARYRDIEIIKIEESKEAELAAKYDYYYVPTYYVGTKKVHEGAATPAKVEKVLNLALQEETADEAVR